MGNNDDEAICEHDWIYLDSFFVCDFEIKICGCEKCGAMSSFPISHFVI